MSRPKGSKNKPKNETNIQEIKRPRGRPRKSPPPDPVVVIVKRSRGRPRKNMTQDKILPNTDLELSDDGKIQLEKIDLPELEEDMSYIVSNYKPTRWTSDDWGGSLDNFSISTDFMY